MRYIKAIAACIGLFLVFSGIAYATGLLDSTPTNQGARSALRGIFIVAAILTWKAFTKESEE
jgi:hypothetical protein